MKFFRIGFFFLLATLTTAVTAASALPDPLTAVRVSMLGLESQVIAEPLPNLENGTRAEFPVQASYLTANFQGIPAPQMTAPSGSFQGGAAMLGYFGPSHGEGREFVTFFTNQVHGQLDLGTPDSGSHFEMKHLISNGFGLVAGEGYRLIGESKSFFALGIFGGPAAFKMSSTGTFDAVGMANSRFDFSSSAFTYGALAGFQAALRLGKFVVNPYALFFADLSESDRPITISGQSDSFEKVPGSFKGFGLNLSYRSFKVNVISQLSKELDLDNINLTTYSVSWTFNFDD